MPERPETVWTMANAEDVGLDGRNWDRAVLGLETGTMFHSTGWVEAIARGFHRKAGYTAFLDRTGGIKGLLPVQEGKAGPFRTTYSPITIVTPYGGPASAAEDLHESLAATLSLMKKKGWDYLRLALPPKACIATEDFGAFDVLRGTTRLIPLGPEEAMWKGLNRRCRRYIAKAEEAGVEVRDVKDFAFLDAYLEWGEQTFGRTDEEFPTPREFYLALRDLVQPSGSLLVCGAFVSGRAVTIEFFGLAGGTLYAIDSAMDRKAAVDGAGNKLTWETMKMAAARGAREFDMLGTNLPRIAEYKQSFGGSLSSRSHLSSAHNLESATRAFRLARRLAGGKKG